MDTDLKTYGQIASQMTGRRFVFIVETVKADGTDLRKVDVKITARNTAQAWHVIGTAIWRFMEGPQGRFINSVHILREPA